MPDFTAAIFDLDGTLLDSMGVWAQIDREFLKKRGLEVTEAYIRAVTPMTMRQGAEHTVRLFGLAESPEEIEREWQRMCHDAYHESVVLKPGAAEFLARLKQSGIKLGVATGLTPNLYRPALHRNGVLHLFDAFASLDEVERGKEFPDVYLLCAERLGTTPRACLVFEDLLAGIGGAKSGGFSACGLYDPFSAADWEAVKRAADISAVSFAELQDLVLDSFAG